MSFFRPLLNDLIARMQADADGRLPGADSRVRRNFLNGILRTFAGEMNAAYGMLDTVSRFLPDVADADRLARWASIFGLTRKAAEAPAGPATATGTTDRVVPAGTILNRADGARYVVSVDATLVAGTATLAIVAEGSGTAGEMVAGQELTFASPIAGIGATVTVAAPGIFGGIDEETDEELRARLLLRMRNPVRGGSASDYVGWAREVAEVTRAWVYENASGLGTVTVLFVMDGRADIIPAGPDTALVAAYIAERRPVCAAVTVAGPVATPLNFTITPVPDTPAVRAAIAAELRDLIGREAEPGGTLLISHIREAISLSAGETDHSLTTPSANVTASAGHISTMGTITWPS